METSIPIENVVGYIVAGTIVVAVIVSVIML